VVFTDWLNKNTHLLLFFMVISTCTIIPCRALAAELIMFSSPECSWCEAWEKDVGIIFQLTEEAKYFQLTHVDITDPLPPRLSNLDAVQYTPTFVVLDKQQEIGRITGYTSEGLFWWELQNIIKRLPNAIR